MSWIEESRKVGIRHSRTVRWLVYKSRKSSSSKLFYRPTKRLLMCHAPITGSRDTLAFAVNPFLFIIPVRPSPALSFASSSFIYRCLSYIQQSSWRRVAGSSAYFHLWLAARDTKFFSVGESTVKRNINVSLRWELRMRLYHVTWDQTVLTAFRDRP